MKDTKKTATAHTNEPPGSEDTPTVPTEQPTVVESKSSVFNSRKFVIAFVVAVVIIAAAIVTWFVLTANKSENSDSTDMSSHVQRSVADRVVTGAFVAIEGESMEQDVTVSSLGGQTEGGTVLYDFAPYQVPGSAFRVLPATGSGNAIKVSNAIVESSQAELVESFKASGLSRVDSSTADATGLKLNPHVSVASYDIYKSDHTICSLARLTSKGGAPQDSQILSSGCANVADYKKAATTAAPIFAAYKKSYPAADGRVTLSTPEISDSNGVKRATVYQFTGSQGGVHTYAQPNGGEWSYDKAL